MKRKVITKEDLDKILRKHKWLADEKDGERANALDLIKRREQEIEEQDQAIINALHHMKVVRAEAIKEFAERLKREMQNLSWCDYRGWHYFLVDESFVDNVLKKFTEENSND